MLNNIVLGSYYNVNSKIHKIHPLSKIIFTLLCILSLVFTKSYICIACFLILLPILILLSKVPRALYVNFFWKMKYFLIAILIVNIVFSSSMFTGIIIVLKMIIMILMSSLLLFTTSTSDIIYGLKMLLAPLKILHISSDKIAFSLSLAIRFIPILLEQSYRIFKAQLSRGLNYKELNLKGKINALRGLIVPMFSLSIRRADVLAEAMEVRGFSFAEKRSIYRIKKFNFLDVAIISVSIIMFALVIFCEVCL